MDWNPLNWFQKANPAQEQISREAGSVVSSDQAFSYVQAFNKLEAVNRGVNMIVNGCVSLDYDIKDKTLEGVVINTRQKTLDKLLNYRPNPYQSIQAFRAALFTDYLLEGNFFIYWDGTFMYHLPAAMVQIEPDEKTFINKYTYNNTTIFSPDEIIHVQDTSGTSIYRGTSRLQAADRSIKILYKMQNFQDQFFENGAIPGIVLETENTLSQLAKDKTIEKWRSQYSPKNGAKKPLILDSGLKLKTIFEANFKDMDFDVSIARHDEKILSVLGVPPLLLNGGNNANISPNLRLFYLETIMPIVRNYVSAIERFFGYDIDAITSNVTALQPDLKEIAAYHATLVNGGIISPNEARTELRYEPKTGHDNLRIPANIAGSAADPSQGGKPPSEGNN